MKLSRMDVLVGAISALKVYPGSVISCSPTKTGHVHSTHGTPLDHLDQLVFLGTIREKVLGRLPPPRYYTDRD